MGIDNQRLYTIGLDFGSLSGRGVLADTSDGRIIAEAEYKYPHGVIDRELPCGLPLQSGWMLQHPGDYLEALCYIVPRLVADSGADPRQIAGMGLDFTSSTVVALDESFSPLCFDEKWASRPHAWPKLWKHHAAAPYAERLSEISARQGRPYLSRYGGAVPAESLLPKVVQVFEEDSELFEAVFCFAEAADYITSLLAGKPVFSGSIASARALWDRREGYPDSRFFSALSPGLSDLPQTKLAGRFPGAVFGYPGEPFAALCPAMAEKLGLPAGIALSAPQMDAYAAMPGIGITEPGAALLVMGTSTGIMLLGEGEKPVEGVTASLPDTFYPGLQGYGSGQSSVGDCFQWFVDNCLPASYQQAAEDKGISPHSYLTELASALAPGEMGLIALDWFNGNRSCLANAGLSGMVLGLNLATRPEHIYRALLEATAFGAKTVLAAYERAGVPVREAAACGGIAVKNPWLMQLYADILGKPLRISHLTQAPALGSAIYAAAAAGDKTGYRDIFQAVKAMGGGQSRLLTPDPVGQAAYEPLYQEYITLHDYFGRGGNKVMERMTNLRGSNTVKKEANL